MPGVWETDAEWRRLDGELRAWHAHRVRADVLGQHRSQLAAVYALLHRILTDLREPIASLTGASAQVGEQCRVHDRRLVWLRRLWDFFRERFDQRDDPTLAPLLRGADEVVWSCHREPFAALETPGTASSEPPPLPYVEPGTTPEVFPHGLVPGSLRRDVDAPFLRRALEELPFAVVRVPATCVTAPWWLVHLGHEVGHVVDGRLCGHPAWAELIDRLQLADASAELWLQWSSETFADAYAVLMHGPWAVWALAMAESQADEAMTTRRDNYPPPAARLLVMTHACRLLDATTDELTEVEPHWQALVARDATLVSLVDDGRRVVKAMLDAGVRLMPWASLTAWEAPPWTRKALGTWVSTMSGRPKSEPARPRRAWARHLVAASVLRRKDGNARADFDGAAIAADLLAWLPLVREPGSRAMDGVSPDRVRAQGAALARRIMEVEALP